MPTTGTCRDMRPPLLLLGSACFAANISVRACDPMLPLIAHRFTISPVHAAWLSVAYGLPYAMAQPVLGPLADTIGKPVVIRTCLALLAASFAACAVVPGFDALLFARGAGGVLAGGIFPVAIALVADGTGREVRQVAISRLVVAAITGQMVGAASAGIIAERTGWRGVFGLMALFAGIVAIATLLRLDGGDAARRPFSLARVSADYRSLLRSPGAPVIYGTVLLEGVFMFGVFPFVAPMLLMRKAGGSAAAGLCIAAYALGALFYGISAGLVVSRMGPRRMVAAGGVLVGLCYAAVAIPSPWPVTAGAVAVSGFGFYVLHNTMQTLTTELAPQARGAAVGLLASLFFLGQALGPLLAGEVAAVGGYGAMFVLAAAAMALLGTIASSLLPRPGPGGSARTQHVAAGRRG